MSFKSDYRKYTAAMKKSEEATIAIDDFFSKFDLSYAITYCKGDGVMLLDCDAGNCGFIDEDQVEAISKAKTREEVLKVIEGVSFYA